MKTIQFQEPAGIKLRHKSDVIMHIYPAMDLQQAQFITGFDPDPQMRVRTALVNV